MKAKLSRYFKLILILCPVLIIVLIIILIIIQFVSISRFNSHVYTVKGQDDSLKTWMDLDPRKDSISSWLKRDFEWDGETLDLKAPTHDLGKITIENTILNKPGKLTDEEYAAKGLKPITLRPTIPKIRKTVAVAIAKMHKIFVLMP